MCRFTDYNTMNIITSIQYIRYVFVGASIPHLDSQIWQACTRAWSKWNTNTSQTDPTDLPTSYRQINRRQTARHDQIIIKDIKIDSCLHIVLDINRNRHPHIINQILISFNTHLQSLRWSDHTIIVRSPVSIHGQEVTYFDQFKTIWYNSLLMLKTTKNYRSILLSTVSQLYNYHQDNVLICSDFLDYDHQVLNALTQLHHIDRIQIPIGVIWSNYRAREIQDW